MPALPQVIEQHALEAAMLWRLREGATVAARGTLSVVERFDRRIEAHLDGLRIAGAAGWRAVWAGLAEGRAESVFPAAWLALDTALDGGGQERVDALLQWAGEDAEALRGLRAALGWLPFEQLWSRVERWLASAQPLERALGLAACHDHRRDPLGAVEQALGDDQEPVLLAAVAAAGELGRVDLVRRLRGLRDASPAPCETVRYAAARAGVLLGDPSAAEMLRQSALDGGDGCEETAELAARALPPPAAQALVRELGSAPQTARAAVLAAGASGLPELVPWLIERMDDPALARAAGAAVERITAIPLASDADGEGLLVASPPAGFQAGPNDDPADPAVAMDPDAGLPFPATDAVGDWWLRERQRFAVGVRFLAGEPAATAPLARWLAEGRSPLRRAAALERKLRAPAEPYFPWRAPAARQRALLTNADRAGAAADGDAVAAVEPRRRARAS
jgi:uncharacterized protein (TIGR02270 family)